MKEVLLHKEVLHADESIDLYEYHPVRNHERAKEFLKGFTGYLIADG